MKFLIFLVFISLFFCKKPPKLKPSLFPLSPTSFATFRFKQSPLTRANTIQNSKSTLNANEDIGQGPIYKKGWLKYLPFTSKSTDTCSQFTKNPAYFDQNPDNPLRKHQKDDCGSLEIPDAFHFFFYLTFDALYIVSARKNDLAKTFRVLNFKSNTMKNSEMVLGIEDQGDYQEGYCFKLRVNNCGSNEFVILCSDNLADKLDWIKRISVLKLKCQNPSTHLINEVVIQANINGNSQYQTKYSEDFKENIVYKTQKIDGKWVVLQDWSSCTLACGNGSQTLHRFCIPPSDGGMACEGQGVVNRSCNTQACPNVRVVVEEKVAPTRIKMMRISKRPQRYEVNIFSIFFSSHHHFFLIFFV